MAENAYQPLADAYRSFRAALGKSQPPLNVVVTASGEIDTGLPIFQSGLVPVLERHDFKRHTSMDSAWVFRNPDGGGGG